MPSFKDVPEDWKAPRGPYYQAPAEHGGEWWLRSPFNPYPWLKPKPTQAEKLPEGFEGLFGPRPVWSKFRETGGNYRAFQVVVVEWEQELRFFKGTGRPEWVTPSALDSAVQVYLEWNMGTPTFYETNTGWMARFLDSRIGDHDASAYQTVKYPHHTVSQYQIELFLDHGLRPEKWHPYVPPTVFLRGKETKKEIERRIREARRNTRTVPA